MYALSLVEIAAVTVTVGLADVAAECVLLAFMPALGAVKFCILSQVRSLCNTLF